MMEGFAAALAVIGDDVSPVTQTASDRCPNDTPAPVLLMRAYLSAPHIALLVSDHPARIVLPFL